MKRTTRRGGFALTLALALGGGMPAMAPAGMGAGKPAARPTVTPPACPNPGEQMVARGLTGAPRCVRRYSDGGKACSAKSQCQGRCIATRIPRGVPPAIGARTAGVCEAEHPTYGCFATIDRGKLITPMLCTS